MVSPFGFQAATTRVRAYNLAKHLARGGDRVLLIVSGKMRRKERNLRILGVGREEKSAKDFLISTFSKYFALRKLKGFEIYHSFKALPWASFPTWLAKHRKKIVIDLDDWETETAKAMGGGFRAGFVEVFEYSLPKLFDGVIVVSELLRQECLKMGVPEDRVLKLPYGCDVETFKPMPRNEGLAKKLGVRGKRVIYTGTIDPLNLRILVNAMKRVSAEVKDLVLLVVSPGWDLGEFNSYMRKLGLPEKDYVVLGRQPHELMPALLSVADVIYAPNRFIKIDEARSPSRVGEYMAAAKPIVANAVGVVREQLSDGAGSLVYSYDPKELCTKLIEILEDKRFAKKMGKKARKKAEKIYSWSILTHKLREFYVEIRG